MRKIIWLVLSGLMVLSLVITACGPAAAPEQPTAPSAPQQPAAPTAPTTPEQPAAPAVPEKPTASPDVPKYGGTLTYRLATDPTNFDSGINRSGGALGNTVYQQHMGADWTKGPAGSGVTNLAVGFTSAEDMQGPILVDRWEMPEIGVWKLHIRQGVRWQPANSDAGRLMAGRELTADDIVYNFNRHISAPESWFRVGQPTVATTASIEKTGPWDVTIKTPVDYLTAFSGLIQGSGFTRIQPPQVIERYGNLGNWRNAVGTGPFMLVDYVPGSQFLFIRNPNYWETNPLGPGKGNQLPYVDTLRELIIPDLSTTYAALRTGKLDLQSDIALIDAQSLFKTSPKLEYLKYLSTGPWAIAMRQDKKDKPFSDVRVRQALVLATDFEAFKRAYFGGEAEIDVWPVSKDLKAMYKPLSEMPESVRALYKYNPDKAKQLLKEAGYPGGFKTSVVINSSTERIDELSIFKDMWAKVGIELSIDIRDNAVYSQISGVARSFDDMLYRSLFGSFSIQIYFSAVRGSAINNPSRVNDPIGTIPYIEELYAEMNKYIFTDWPKTYEIHKKIKPFFLENAFLIVRPTPYTYNMWWPWLKNYYGQGTGMVRYSWIDQDLKKSMGY
ncbi:MAG: ABC transporter substrate-binding protein [Chloroflexota bacterium]